MRRAFVVLMEATNLVDLERSEFPLRRAIARWRGVPRVRVAVRESPTQKRVMLAVGSRVDCRLSRNNIGLAILTQMVRV